MKPVFAVHTLSHKIKLNGFIVLVGRKIAVAIYIVKRFVVLVLCVFIFFLRFKLTTKRKLRVSTVTSKRGLAVQFKHFMTFMAYQHASQTKSVRLYFLCQFLLSDICSFGFRNLFKKTSLAGENWLIDIALFISTLFDVL